MPRAYRGVADLKEGTPHLIGAREHTKVDVSQPTAVPLPATIAVDLDVRDVPLRVAVEQIAKQIPPTDRLRIVVDESVPKDLRVTAQFRKAPLNWVIDSLVQQAGLSYGIQEEPDPQLRADLEVRVREGLMDSVTMEQQLANAPRLRTVYRGS